MSGSCSTISLLRLLAVHVITGAWYNEIVSGYLCAKQSHCRSCIACPAFGDFVRVCALVQYRWACSATRIPVHTCWLLSRWWCFAWSPTCLRLLCRHVALTWNVLCGSAFVVAAGSEFVRSSGDVNCVDESAFCQL